MQIFVRAFLLGVRLGMKTNVVVVRREKVFNPSNWEALRVLCRRYN